jgi:hypothetical protein
MRSKEELLQSCEMINETMGEAHRGAIPSEGGRAVLLFGNDGWSEEQTKKIVGLVRETFQSAGWRLGDVVSDQEDYTWVFEAEPTGAAPNDEIIDWCAGLLWNCWFTVKAEARPERIEELKSFALTQIGVSVKVIGNPPE